MIAARVVLIAAAAAALAATVARAESFRILTDPGATHEIVERTPKSRGMVEVITRRTTGRGAAAVEYYSRRLLDCAGGRYQLLNAGETLDDAKAEPTAETPVAEVEDGADSDAAAAEADAPSFEPISPGAISAAIWTRGCEGG